MRRKALRIIFLSILWVAGVSAIAAAAFYWRLSQGPVSLAFLGTRIEDAINRQLPGLKISLGEAEIELDSETGTPNVRARNLVLSNAEGELIASAPKAGVSLDASKLLQGTISVRTLELIGPRISARINLDGTFQLGIANDAAAPDQEVVVDGVDAGLADGGKSDRTDPSAQPAGLAQNPLTSGSKLLALLDSGGQQGTLSRLEEVKITRAALQLYDEANDASWLAPRADLAFKRVPSGFVVVTKASIASSKDPWNIEASATYRRETKDYTANVAIDDLVPANVAEKIFALSQFARVNIPFSGHFQIEARETGEITKADGQLFASAGQVNLPDYLAKPILVDEGSMRVVYGGASKQFEIVESSILMGGSRADLKGTIVPNRGEDGRLTSLGINLSADNVAVDAQGTVRDAVFVDRVSFVGKAAIEEQRVDIDDLVVMAGNTGIRLRGVITGGEESAGIQFAGRMRDVSAALLKKLWPPVLAPRTRNWINENIVDGRISDGVFQVNFPVNELARSQREKHLQPGAVDLTFNMADVTSHYFKSLPVLQQASGTAHLKDEAFTLSINDGVVQLPEGGNLKLASGTFEAHDLLTVEVPGTFNFDIRGSVQDMLALAGQRDLNMITTDFASMPRIDGTARALIGLKLPLIKDVPKTRVTLTTDVTLENASVKSIMPGIDLTGGTFNVDITKDIVTVQGPAKVNNVAAKVQWQKVRGGGAAKAVLETTLDDTLRNKLGLKLDDYMSGDVPVKVTISDGEAGRTIDVAADLSDVAMKISAAGWSRPKTDNTTASFQIVDNGKSGRVVKNLEIDGAGLHLRGDVNLKPGGGFSLIDLSEIRLTGDDVFAARLEPADGSMNLTLSGTSFDARPYIKNLISPAKASDGDASSQGGTNFIVSAKFKEVIAHRGESIRDVSGTFVSRGGQINTATIQGRFLSGLPLTVRLTPTASGREMRVASADGGATLRASNFYSKIAGGELEFYALMANAPGSPIRNGMLTIRRFEVRNEAALAELDNRGRPKKSGPRTGGVTFKRLTLPFTTDAKFVRLCGVELRGNDLGGVAQGLIRKSDGAIDISGTMIPVQGLNGVLGDVPLLGQILTGGRGEGLFGITFAMGGTIGQPRTQVNPLSALAPGIFRKAFEFQGTCGARNGTANPVGTGKRN